MSDETNEHVPNFVISRQEASGATAGFIRFYPKDDEKLKELREVAYDKYIKYRSALIDAGRFISEDGEIGQKKWRKALSDSGIALHTEEVAGVKWIYTVRDGAASIGDGFGVAISPSTSGEITIPSTLGGYPVTSIGESAFSGCRWLTDVAIPANVTRIGNYAFEDCSSLTSVRIPASVKDIGCTAFSHCCNLTRLVAAAEGNAVYSSAKDVELWIQQHISCEATKQKIEKRGRSEVVQERCLDTLLVAIMAFIICCAIFFVAIFFVLTLLS